MGALVACETAAEVDAIWTKLSPGGAPLMELRLTQHLNGALDALHDMVTITETGDCWLRYRAPATGILRMNTRGSSFDTLLAVYTGSTVSNLILVASNDDTGLDVGNATRKMTAGAVDLVIAVAGVYRI